MSFQFVTFAPKIPLLPQENHETEIWASDINMMVDCINHNATVSYTAAQTDNQIGTSFNQLRNLILDQNSLIHQNLIPNIEISKVTNLRNELDKNLLSAAFSGNINKTLTLTRIDGTTITASFIDEQTDENGDTFLNSGIWNDTNGNITFQRNDATTFSVNIDGRYSLISHSHDLSSLSGIENLAYTHTDNAFASQTINGSLQVSGVINTDTFEIRTDSSNTIIGNTSSASTYIQGGGANAIRVQNNGQTEFYHQLNALAGIDASGQAVSAKNFAAETVNTLRSALPNRDHIIINSVGSVSNSFSSITWKNTDLALTEARVRSLRLGTSPNFDLVFESSIGGILTEARLSGNGDFIAQNFIGNWNGKLETDFLRTTGSIAQNIDGIKEFSDRVATNNGLTVGNYLLLLTTTFSTLPTNGNIAIITDASNVAYRGLASGGGSARALVIKDGANWIYH